MDSQQNRFEEETNREYQNQQEDSGNVLYSYQNNYTYDRTVPTRQDKFVTCSLIFGLLAFFTSMFIFTPFIFGALSILFAVFSKRSTEKMAGAAIAGISTSVFSMLSAVCMVGIVYYLIFNVPEYRELMNQQYEQIYGQSFDEMLESMENGTFNPNSLTPR